MLAKSAAHPDIVQVETPGAGRVPGAVQQFIFPVRKQEISNDKAVEDAGAVDIKGVIIIPVSKINIPDPQSG